MLLKLYIGLMLFSCNAEPFVEGSPVALGRSGDYPTLPSEKKLSQDAETVVEDSEINKIVAFATLTRSTPGPVDENNGDSPITNPSKTSVSKMPTIIEALQNRPTFEENVNAFHSELLTSTAKSENGSNVSLNDLTTVNNAGTTTLQSRPQYHAFTSKITQMEDDEMPSNHDSYTNFQQTALLESLVTTPHSRSFSSLVNDYDSDYENLQNENVNEHNMEGSMNDDENDEDEDSLPSALKNLPHDIPPDRTIYEVLAENIVKDKQYDEFRMEELIHELMDHYDTQNGFGEVYAGEADYEDKVSPENKGSVPILELITDTTSTAVPYDLYE